MTQDLRRSPRVLLDVDVEVLQGDARARGRSHDVSLGGMFVACAVPPSMSAFGAQVTLRFQVPGAHETLSMNGIVRWKRDDGIGVQFLPFGVRETVAITEWVAKSGQ